MKLLPLLLFVAAFALTGCNTLPRQLELFSPKRGSGYWTEQWKNAEVRPLRHVARPGPEILGHKYPDRYSDDVDRE